MKRIKAASVAAIRDDRFLLVLRGRGAARGQYAFPGGRSEAGETAEQTARREFIEETALVPGRLTPISRVEIDGEEVLYELDVFLCLDAEGDAVAGDDAEAVGWYTLEDMASLDVTLSTLEMARDLATSHCGPTAERLEEPVTSSRES
ncbi:NUDIX hydrolase [Aliihoeflea aestuarii]|uniref:NUDIX hydrolase n=1 Tax=Aliihoeflea aestuarii TaxID=453840 RepID=UPI00209429BD|nr:NUDIX domain-containing protein [Aliihoeflea aestuarii]